MRIIKGLIAVLFALALVACTKPLPADKAAYAGEWHGAGMTLLITQDGSVKYTRVDGNANKSIDGPLKEFEGNNFSVGVGPLATTFIVSAAPHPDGSTWKMTVDTIELTRK
jgi:hypothetical protein